MFTELMLGQKMSFSKAFHNIYDTLVVSIFTRNVKIHDERTLGYVYWVFVETKFRTHLWTEFSTFKRNVKIHEKNTLDYVY